MDEVRTGECIHGDFIHIETVILVRKHRMIRITRGEYRKNEKSKKHVYDSSYAAGL